MNATRYSKADLCAHQQRKFSLFRPHKINMDPSMLSPSYRLKPALFLAVFAMASVSAAAAAPTAPDSKIAMVILSPDEAVQKELVELDRLLDVNPKFEEILRKNIDRLEDEQFRKAFSDVNVLLKQKPGLVPALKVERHVAAKHHIFISEAIFFRPPPAWFLWAPGYIVEVPDS